MSTTIAALCSLCGEKGVKRELVIAPGSEFRVCPVCDDHACTDQCGKDCPPAPNFA